MRAVPATILAALVTLALIAAVGGDDKSELPLSGKQSHESVALDGKRKVTWKSVTGRQVTAEGIAWADGKGLGERVILDGTTIYARHGDTKPERGRLTSVSGTLSLENAPASPRTSQGFSSAFSYYTIRVTEWKYVDAVASPLIVAH